MILCLCVYVCVVCVHTHTQSLIYIYTYIYTHTYISIILATFRTETSSQPLTDGQTYNNLSPIEIIHLLLLDVHIKKLVLDEIICYIFNYTDLTGQTVKEPEAALTEISQFSDQTLWHNNA